MQSASGAIIYEELKVKEHFPTHVCMVVKDVEKACEFWWSTMGIGPWYVWEHSFRKEEIIVGEPCTFKIACMGSKLERQGVILEIIQPVAGKGGCYEDFIETRGEGYHHIAMAVPDLDKQISKMEKAGAKIVMRASYYAESYDYASNICYMEWKPGGIILEFMERKP